MAPVGRAAVAPPQMRPPMMPGPPTGMMQGTKATTEQPIFRLLIMKLYQLF